MKSAHPQNTEASAGQRHFIAKTILAILDVGIAASIGATLAAGLLLIMGVVNVR